MEVVYTRNNHSAMMDATNDKEVAFVGGTRGGFIFPEFLFSIDGMYAVAKIMEMVAHTGKTLGQLNKELPRRSDGRSRRGVPVGAEGACDAPRDGA